MSATVHPADRPSPGRRLQIGPTLYFQTVEPHVGERIRTHDGEAEILDVTHSPEDGGWLFTVEPTR